MAISVVQTKTGAAAGGPVAAIALTSSVTSGSLLVLCIHWYQGGGTDLQISSISDSQGNTWVRAVRKTDSRHGSHEDNNEIWYAQNAIAGSTTITPTLSASQDCYYTAGVIEVSGMKTSGVLDVVGSNQGNGPTIEVTASGTTSQDDAFLVSVAQGYDGDNLAYTVPSGYTALYSEPDGGSTEPGAAAYRIETVAATELASWSRSNVNEYTATIAVFLAATGSSGEIGGASSLTITGSGELRGSGALAGTSTLSVAGGTSTLRGSGELSGGSSITLSGSGSATGIGELSGTSSLTVTGSGEIGGLGSLGGTATMTFSGSGELGGLGTLGGSATIAFSGSGELGGPVALGGTAAIAFSGSGELSGLGTLGGSGTFTFGGSGELGGIGALAGSGTMSFEGSGDLAASGTGEMSGTATMTFSGSGLLTDPRLSVLTSGSFGPVSIAAGSEWYIVVTGPALDAPRVRVSVS